MAVSKPYGNGFRDTGTEASGCWALILCCGWLDVYSPVLDFSLEPLFCGNQMFVTRPDLPLASASSDMITKSCALLSSVLDAALSGRILGAAGAGITGWHMAQG